MIWGCTPAGETGQTDQFFLVRQEADGGELVDGRVSAFPASLALALTPRPAEKDRVGP